MRKLFLFVFFRNNFKIRSDAGCVNINMKSETFVKRLDIETKKISIQILFVVLEVYTINQLCNPAYTIPISVKTKFCINTFQ